MNNDRFSTPQTPDLQPGIDIDTIRDKIWDYLFNTKLAHPLEEIAGLVECDVATVRTAINHEWFHLAGNRVSIAYVAGGV